MFLRDLCEQVCLTLVSPLSVILTGVWAVDTIASVGIADCQVFGKFRVSAQVARVDRVFGVLPGPLAIGVTAVASDTGA